MGNIFREFASQGNTGAQSAIFRNEEALTPEFLPESLEHRQAQINEIAYALRGIPAGKKCENLLLVGPSGTGKTSCSRFVLKQLSEYTGRAVPIYVNCWEFSTRFSVLNLVATKLGEIMPRRGIAADEIMDRISQICRNEKKTPVIVLDEADRLFISKYGEEKILYDIARSGEIFGAHFGLVAITNNANLLSMVDQRIKSSVQMHQLNFEKYTPSQLKDIVSVRAKEAFCQGALDEEVIPVCAAIGAKNNGDARVSITTVWKAGLAAERQGAKKVLVSHVKEASKEVIAQIRQKDLEMVSDAEKSIIAAIKSAGGQIESGALYAKLEKSGVQERTARNYIEKLELGGFLEATEVQKQHGRTRLIRLLV